MAFKQQDNTMYLDPVTNEYYTQQAYYPQNNNFMGNDFSNGLSGFFANRNNYYMPRNLRKNSGDFSMVAKAMQNKQPYQYNVPSLASLFSLMSMPSMTPQSQYTGGAGQFLGGLLGLPTGAPASQQS